MPSKERQVLLHSSKLQAPVADPENFGGGMIKILSTKPQKFGCVVTRRVARNSQWSGCFRVLGQSPSNTGGLGADSAQKFCIFLQK